MVQIYNILSNQIPKINDLLFSQMQNYVNKEILNNGLRYLYKLQTSMRHLFWILLILCFSASLSAQTKKLQNRPYIDQRRFHYGFLLGIHTQDLEFKNSGRIDQESGEQWYADVDTYSPGFQVGILGELRINTFLALRSTPTLSFGQKRIIFHEQVSKRDSSQNIKSTLISVPIDIKFTPPRFNNYRPYFLAGISPTIDLTSKKNQAVRINPFDLYIELGVGCDIYLPFFKLIPELKFSFGLLDILQKKRDDLTNTDLLKYSAGLEKASSRMISLTFYFE